ncbi:glutathionylspermidine synthase family protein [Paenibacillus sp. BK033]|uniref:glutathionylspermidine synthase family protein n=1 Tax=unclassified Paenibacillus TaxID=185978 RepID=UPI001045E07F|nr:glutathionylspermidine synthase family protein [Paenibacillus sp. BK033]NIK67490.1 glutathionylspermidine synthase [Paenibacillus sp. BK720]TCN01533.1 glutathionylspermidine synthase [Paenibacillus sp. BK033]
MKDFAEERSAFYSGIEGYWADLYGEEYSLYDLYDVTKEEVHKIRESTNRIGHIFCKAAQLLRTVDDETLLMLGFPRATLSYLRMRSLSVESVIARLDLVKAGDTYKCMEINSDTPTFIKELHHVNGLVCEAFDRHNPNKGYETQLAFAVEKAVIESLEYLGDDPIAPHVAFTAHGDNVEDASTALYLQSLLPLPSTFVPLDQLQIIRHIGLYDGEGNRIHVLYRQTFPVENFIEDEDEEGNPIGLWLLELIERKKLAVINPPSAFLLQSKAVQAIIWGLHEERSPFFTEEEQRWIGEYFLPTYLEPDRFLKERTKYVMKPAFGREGDTVKIFDGDGTLAAEDKHNSYAHYLPVYQEYVELPTAAFRTEKGEREGSYMYGSFLVGGKAGAIGIRIGSPITDNLSYFMPVGITKSE